MLETGQKDGLEEENKIKEDQNEKETEFKEGVRDRDKLTSPETTPSFLKGLVGPGPNLSFLNSTFASYFNTTIPVR